MRDVPAARNFLDLWLDHRCGAERWYHPLRDAAYRAGVAGGCLKSEGARLDREPHAHGEAARAELPVPALPDLPLRLRPAFVMPEFHVLKAHDAASGASDLERSSAASRASTTTLYTAAVVRSSSNVGRRDALCSR